MLGWLKWSNHSQVLTFVLLIERPLPDPQIFFFHLGPPLLVCLADSNKSLAAEYANSIGADKAPGRRETFLRRVVPGVARLLRFL